MLDVPPPLDRLLQLDARLRAWIATRAAKLDAIPDTLLVRALCVLVAGFFSVPAAMSVLHHHPRAAFSYLVGLLGVGALALLAWLREGAR